MAHHPYHHGNLRDALIEASLGLIREVGRDAFTLREVARRAEVSHTAPYRHFRDKRDLLAAVAEQGFLALRDAMLVAVARVTGARARIERSGVAYVEHALRYPEHFDVMFSAPWDPNEHPGADAAARSAFGVLVSFVAECQEAGVLPKGDPLPQARTAWALVHGVSTLGIQGQLGFERTEVRTFARNATAAIIRGLSLDVASLEEGRSPAQ